MLETAKKKATTVVNRVKRVGFDNDLQLMFKYLIHTSFMDYAILDINYINLVKPVKTRSTLSESGLLDQGLKLPRAKLEINSASIEALVVVWTRI